MRHLLYHYRGEVLNHADTLKLWVSGSG